MNRMLLDLLDHPESFNEEQIEYIIKNLRSMLDTFDDAKEFAKEVKKCKVQYSELLKLVGELDGIFKGEQ